MRIRRLLAAVTLAVSAVLGTQSLPGIPAAAAMAAPGPLIADSCVTTVGGTPGQRVLLDPGALTDPIADVLAGLDPLGTLVPAFRSTWDSLPPIPLGTVPTGGTVFSGAHIADAAVGRLSELPLLGGVVDALTPTVRSVLKLTCSLVVRDTTPKPAPPPDSSPPAEPEPGPPPDAQPPDTQPPGAGPPGAVPPPQSSPEYSIADEPPRLDVPAIGIPPEGIAFNYGGNSVPQFGILGADASLLNSPRAAGSAQALPAESDPLRRPLLLAVLLLALVATQLVRTWVLRARP